MTTTICGTLDRAMMRRQVKRAAQSWGICLDGVWADPTITALVERAMESAYLRGFGDAEDAISAATAPASTDHPDSTDSTDQLMAKAFAAAAERLAAAAAALLEASEAARTGQRNLAIGTAIGADADASAAKSLMDAMSAIARL